MCFPVWYEQRSTASCDCAALVSLPAICCCADDDNDLGLAHVVAKAYLPGVTADSVAQAVAQSPEQFHVAGSRGVFGTEEILRLLVSERLGQRL